MLEVDPAAINGANQLAEVVRQNHSILSQRIKDLGRRISSLEAAAKEQEVKSRVKEVPLPPTPKKGS